MALRQASGYDKYMGVVLHHCTAYNWYKYILFSAIMYSGTPFPVKCTVFDEVCFCEGTQDERPGNVPIRC